MLQTVHTQTGSKHQCQYDKYRGQQLLLLADNDLRDHVQGIVIGIDPEQPEYPDNAEHAEGRNPCREKDRQIIGQKRQKVYDPRKGKNVPQQ